MGEGAGLWSRAATSPNDFSSGRAGRLKPRAGFTLVELLIVMAIVITIAAIAVPNLRAALDAARIARAVADIRALESEITTYEFLNGKLPDTLVDIGRGNLLDPWGSPYQYLNFANAKGKGQMRKDRFLVPLNSTYDLYSMGRDRKSVPPITANVSQDDIIRASDGGYVGLASQY
jgi:general secretion pathway protein G